MPGSARSTGAGLRVGRGAERRRGAGEDLRCGRQLRVGLEPDDDFPGHLVTCHSESAAEARRCQSVACWYWCATPQHARLVEIVADDLQPDRAAPRAETARDRHARQAGEADAGMV